MNSAVTADVGCRARPDFVATPTEIVTLVERHTRYVMLAKATGKDIETVINTLIK